ncbi:DUF1217 domain-containing protein [Parvularcula lutaonensis]|uniref:DUF1217 domain-containing protein n=1 Tax=Parvularcula lutaonensis TaxID=491923 RepID=A0ABV7MEF0_9PROT|nr:DUF1217 domain-containing protein [Parvularcula lutaonensis]GGY50801.1 hypothetical protein GCM10007148_19520 [Parvularcula lutaonensis]
MVSTYTNYLSVEKTFDRRVEAIEKDPVVARESQYFRENIGKISTAEEFVNDDRLYRFALTAFDLESQIFARALVKKVLEEGVEDPKALSNQLVDRKWNNFARAFAFAEVGDFNVKNPEFVEGVIDKYERVQLEERLGEENIAVRLAVYGERKLPGVSNWFSVLGDKALREVVFTALGLPDAVATQNPDRLKILLEDRFDIEDFKDPAKLDKFLQRFALQYDIKNGTSGPVSNTLALFGIFGDGGGGGGNGIIGIDPSTLSARNLF